uniref:Si:dkey-181m9.8 n=1 Tax=Seriola lalandi dorsalis TaxID=1841481 RepID=A0A3B4Y4N1_SERLL
FPSKEKKKLVYLAGTVPVHYESEYNIPVCIWLHETHPVSRPRCYVCPSVSMVINPYCPCVDPSGNISLDGLKNWTHGVSDLSLLVSEMRRAFQVDTPLYARCPDQATMFLSLMRMKGRSFSPSDVMEAVQLNRDLPSALRFLTHSCPICQDQVTFSKMTHCSCFLCQTCFKTFFSAAIKERSIDQLVCPQCGRPEVRGQGGMEESMDYFNLLDTQVHELFQRKLRDRALQEMPNFCWCAHCSFGMLHEADRLRMDCPSCKKSTCSQCRSPCPNCQFIFSLSKGGCLHFTCSQCQHQFCGGCSQTFTLGAACGFSADCGTKGLHAHHPRDCLYHLRDWSVTRLHLLLQEPCGQPALPEYRGYCLHYKERLVELINRCRADPAVLFSLTEIMAELQRWHVAMPTRKPDEPEPLYAQRLRL